MMLTQDLRIQIKMKEITYYWKELPVAKKYPDPKKRKEYKWKLIPPFDMYIMFMNYDCVVWQDDESDKTITTVRDLRKAIWNSKIDPGMQ
jgi:hypothetical protein